MAVSRRFFVKVASLGSAFLIRMREPASARDVPEVQENREFELDRFFVAGFQYHDGPRLIDSIKVGERLLLRREPLNPHDRRAVAVHLGDHRIGYVPKARNAVVSRLCDQHAPLVCRVTAVDVDEDAWSPIAVSISIASHQALADEGGLGPNRAGTT